MKYRTLEELYVLEGYCIGRLTGPSLFWLSLHGACYRAIVGVLNLRAAGTNTK